MYHNQTYFPVAFVFRFNLDSVFLIPQTCISVQRTPQGAVAVQNNLMDPCREAAQSMGVLMSGLTTAQMAWYGTTKKRKVNLLTAFKEWVYSGDGFLSLESQVNKDNLGERSHFKSNVLQFSCWTGLGHCTLSRRCSSHQIPNGLKRLKRL